MLPQLATLILIVDGALGLTSWNYQVDRFRQYAVGRLGYPDKQAYMGTCPLGRT